MAKRPTRLRFTEDDLADSRVKKAADRADKAVDKAEKAADKLASKKAKPKLKLETDAAGSRKAKLRFEKAEFTEIERVPFPVSWTVKMKKKQKETQDILSYHSQAAGCSDKARAKASGGRQPIEECGRTGL